MVCWSPHDEHRTRPIVALTLISVAIAALAGYFAWWAAKASVAAVQVAAATREHDRWSLYIGALIEAGQAARRFDEAVRSLTEAMRQGSASDPELRQAMVDAHEAAWIQWSAARLQLISVLPTVSGLSRERRDEIGRHLAAQPLTAAEGLLGDPLAEAELRLKGIDEAIEVALTRPRGRGHGEGQLAPGSVGARPYHGRMLLVLIGDREDDEGREAGAELYWGAFAGWGAPTRIEADVWLRPRGLTVLGEGVILADGAVEPVLPIEACEAFAVTVAELAPVAARVATATVTTE